MKIKNKKSFEQWLSDTSIYIIKLCGIGSMTIHYYDQKRKGVSSREDSDVVFNIKYHKEYKTAYINYFPITKELYDRNDIVTLVNALTHEICHILAYPLFEASQQRFIMKKNIIDLNEELTESISLIVRQLIREDAPQIYSQSSMYGAPQVELPKGIGGPNKENSKKVKKQNNKKAKQ